VQATLAPGNEPPPHMHSREDELFHVLDGEFDVYVGKEAFKVESGECIFLDASQTTAMPIATWRRNRAGVGYDQILCANSMVRRRGVIRIWRRRT
jgi:hypothetical protein